MTHNNLQSCFSSVKQKIYFSEEYFSLVFIKQIHLADEDFTEPAIITICATKKTDGN